MCPLQGADQKTARGIRLPARKKGPITLSLLHSPPLVGPQGRTSVALTPPPRNSPMTRRPYISCRSPIAPAVPYGKPRRDQVPETEANGWSSQWWAGFIPQRHKTGSARKLVPRHLGFSFVSGVFIFLQLAFGQLPLARMPTHEDLLVENVSPLAQRVHSSTATSETSCTLRS